MVEKQINNAKKDIREFIESNIIKFDDDISFKDNDNIFVLGLVNSFFAMKLLNFVESNFNIEVEDDEIDIKNFSSIDNIMNLIHKKRG